MAFITPTPLRASSTRATPSSLTTQNRPAKHLVPSKHACPSTVQATALQPNRPDTATFVKQRQRKSAPVVDSRVASRFEAHHWITVQNQSQRLFERAAVAQVDLTRQLERTQGREDSALHRWVLREIDVNPYAVSRSSAVNSTSSRYLVTESFDKQATQASKSVTKRWLSAVKRVGPLISATIDIHSLQYSDVFTSKKHDVVFDPSENIVVIHCLNINKDLPRSAELLIDALRAKAERAVSVGSCLEFCVLQSDSKPSLLKTIEIFPSMEALMQYANGSDKLFEQTIKPHVVDGRQGRYVFKPVVFS